MVDRPSELATPRSPRHQCSIPIGASHGRRCRLKRGRGQCLILLKGRVSLPVACFCFSLAHTLIHTHTLPSGLFRCGPATRKNPIYTWSFIGRAGDPALPCHFTARRRAGELPSRRPRGCLRTFQSGQTCCFLFPSGPRSGQPGRPAIHVPWTATAGGRPCTHGRAGWCSRSHLDKASAYPIQSPPPTHPCNHDCGKRPEGAKLVESVTQTG